MPDTTTIPLDIQRRSKITGVFRLTFILNLFIMSVQCLKSFILVTMVLSQSTTESVGYGVMLSALSVLLGPLYDSYIPINILNNGLLLFTTIYGGCETTSLVAQTVNLPVGDMKPLPHKQEMRMWLLLIMWSMNGITSLILLLITNAHTTQDFQLTSIFTGIVLAYVSIGLSNRANKAAKEFSTKNNEKEISNESDEDMV